MIHRLANTALLLWALLAVLCPGAWGQRTPYATASGQDRSGLLVDYATFYDTDSGKVRLELYYQFHNHVLQFNPSGGGFVAAYEVEVRVRDKKGNQVGSYSRSREIRVANQERAVSRSDFRTNQATFRLDPGKYVVEFTLRDKNTQAALRRELKMKLKDYERQKPVLSDIEFVAAAGPVQEDPLPFDKGNFTLVPSLDDNFGKSENNRLMFYVEIYRGSDSADHVFVETTVRPRWGSMVYRDSLTAEFNEATVRQLREISLADFSPGEYELEICLRGRMHKKLDTKTRSFWIMWSQEALLRHDYKAALDLLGYIARPGELDSLRKLDTYQQRLQAFNAFWLARDPTPGTRLNEVKREFYRRVEFANRSFGFMRRQGWRTDRGCIYIKHGEPDQIDDYPLALDRHPYQEWHYYRGDRYRKFTYVDENEDGDYRLVYPFDGLYLRPDF